MYTNSSETAAFQSGKSQNSLEHLGVPSGFLMCKLCDRKRAVIRCLNCEQNQCEECSNAIHSKIKGAQHSLKPIEADTRSILNAIFLSFASIKEATSFSVTDQAIGFKFIDFITSYLELNKISEEESVNYIYYSSEDDVSQELLTKLCSHTEKLNHCYFMNVNKVHLSDEVKNIQFNKDTVLATDQKVVALAKCVYAISKGYQRVYIYDHKHSTQVGALILTAEGSEGSESYKVFVSEPQVKQGDSRLMKMEELTPKRSMKLLTAQKQQETENKDQESNLFGKGQRFDEGRKQRR